MGDIHRWYSLMHAIISLVTNYPPAPEQTLQLAGQTGPVKLRRARSCHHHQQHTRNKAGAVNPKELPHPPFDPVARGRISDLA